LDSFGDDLSDGFGDNLSVSSDNNLSDSVGDDISNSFGKFVFRGQLPRCNLMVMHDHLDSRGSKKLDDTFCKVRPARLGSGAARGETFGDEKHLDSIVRHFPVLILRTPSPSDLQDSETGAHEKMYEVTGASSGRRTQKHKNVPDN
jgi:hypothetical protein